MAVDLGPDPDQLLEMRLDEVLSEVRAEVLRSVLKHGPEAMAATGHSVGKRLGILGEEFGEVCRATTYDNGDPAELRSELIQTAAMGAAWVVAGDAGGDFAA